MFDSKTYKIEKNEGYTIITFEEGLTQTACKNFEADLDDICSTKTHVILSCAGLVLIPTDWMRHFMKVFVRCKAEGKVVKLIHVNHALIGQLKEQGLDHTFKIAKDLKEALTEFGITYKRSLDIQFINPFLEATIHVLKVQAQVEAHAGKVTIKKSSDNVIGDISGVIGIVSEHFNGSVVISFPEQTFLKVMSGMLGEEFTKLDQEIIDGAGEITNMIFGQAKISLNEKNYGIKTAIPSVVTGKNHTLSSMTKGPKVVIPFESTSGNFFVEICLSA